MRRKWYDCKFVALAMGFALTLAVAPAVALAEGETVQGGSQQELATEIQAQEDEPVIEPQGDNDWSRFDSVTYHCTQNATWYERQLTEDYQTLIIDPGVTLRILYGISTTKSFQVYGGGTLIVGEALRDNNNMVGFAGIGGDPYRPNSGHITIGSDAFDGTTVIAYGSPCGAGVGGGEGGAAGGIDVKGNAKLQAYGGVDAAGIGGGRNGSSSFINNSIHNINFYDCDVYAAGGCTWGGGDQPLSHNAPGIGSGNNLINYDVRYSNIYIYRGSVFAQGGGDDAAAIGGGKNCDEGRVTIYGGKVTAAGTIGNARSVSSGNRHVQLDPTGTNLEMTTDDYITAEGYGDGVFVGPVYRSSLMNKETGEIFAGEYAQDTPGLINATLVTVRPFVTFDSAGGTAVAGQAVVEGECASKPEDPTREGYTFGGWYLNNQPYDFATPVQGNITLVAKWVSDAPLAPAFMGSQLTVGQQIGLTFWLDLPEAGNLDYSGSYVHFSVDDKAARQADVPLSEAQVNPDNGRHGLTFDLTSIEMAEPVTATFHYRDAGVERTVELTYSVLDYFEDFDRSAAANPGAYPAAMVELVHSTADLGHFMQPFLSASNGWAIGADYEEMGLSYRAMGSGDVAAAKQGISGHRISGAISGSGIRSVGAQLAFDALTGIDVYLTPEGASAQVTASASYGGRTFPAVRQADGRWLVRIEGIKPYDFGKAITVSGNGGKGSFSVSVSVLGVANVDLSGAADQARDQAYASAYYLWKAAQAV